MYKLLLIDCRGIKKQVDGIARYSKLLVENISRINQDSKFKILVLKNKEFKNIRLFPKTNIKEIAVPYFYLSLRTFFCLHLIINKLKPDLIHFPFPVIPLFCRSKKIITVHDLMWIKSPSLQIKGKPIKKISGFIFHKIIFSISFLLSDKIIAVSKTTHSQLIKNCSIYKKKSIVIYQGIQKKLLEGKYKYNPELNNPYLIYFGNTKPYKNVKNLIYAYDLFIKQNPSINLKLKIAGRKDVMRKDIFNLINNNQNIKQKVEILGSISNEDLYNKLCKSIALVFPSIQEGFGIPVIEAFACSVPTVISDIDIFKEISQNNAVFVNPYSIDSIKTGIEKIYFNKEIRSKLSINGPKIAKRFDWSKSANHIFNLYTSLT